MKRKGKPNLWSDVCILIIAILAITAFIRGTWQFWLLIAVFAIWGIYASLSFSIIIQFVHAVIRRIASAYSL